MTAAPRGGSLRWPCPGASFVVGAIIASIGWLSLGLLFADEVVFEQAGHDDEFTLPEREGPPAVGLTLRPTSPFAVGADCPAC